MNKLIIASNNSHKIEEIKQILTPISCKGLEEAGIFEEIEEIADTFEGNAMLKAVSIFDIAETTCLADDSGLEIEALNQAPGIYSARYAGTGKSEDNIKKVLEELKGIANRKAQFRCVLCLFDGKTEQYFEGIVSGTITEEPRGTNGFGYDSIFIPDGYSQTFAELEPNIKNTLSHRGLALQKLVAHIKN